MKKLGFAIAATGLLALAACGSKTETPVENMAENVAMEATNVADSLDAMADNVSNTDAAAVIENAADAVENVAENAADAAN